MGKLLIAMSLFLGTTAAVAQTNFRTNGTGGGTWSTTSTWQVESPNGSNNWIAASSTPTYFSNTITIRANDVVTVTSAVTVDQTTVASSGTLAVNTGVVVTLNNGSGNDLTVNGQINLLGEGYLAGTGTMSVSATGIVSVGSLNATGAVVTGSGGGNIRSGRSFVSGSTIRYEGTGAQAIGSGHATTAAIVINNASGVSLNNTASTVVTATNLTILSGNLTVVNDNLTVNGASSIVELNGGNLIVNGTAAARTLTFRNLILTNGDVVLNSTTYAITLNIDGDATLTNGDIQTSNTAAAVTVNANANLHLTGGTVVMNSGTGNILLTVDGDITGSNDLQATGANANFTMFGSGAVTNAFPFDASSSFEQITWTRTGADLHFPYSIGIIGLRMNAGNVTTDADLLITGDLNVAPGFSFDFSNRTFELRGRYNPTLFGGQLRANASSNLLLTGTGSADTIYFAPSANTLNALTISKTTTVLLNSTLNVVSSVTLTSGTFTNTSGLTLGNAAVFTRNSSGSMSASSAAPAGGPYDVVLQGTTMTTGQELRGSVNTVTNNATGTVTVGSGGFTTLGAFTHNSGTLTCGAIAVTLGGLVNNATFNSASTTLTLNGNLTNNATFNSGTGTVAFGGNSTVGGSSAITFRNITITGILNGSDLLTFQGNFVNNGTFNPGAVTQCTGNISQALSGTATTEFNTLTVNKNSTTTLTLNSATSITTGLNLASGRLSNSGSLLTMESNSTLTRNYLGSLLGTSPLGGPYSVSYTGSSMSTSLEIMGSILDITSSVSGTITVTTPLVSTGTLTVSTGTFTCGSQAITTGSLVVNGTFNAPSTTLSLTGDLTNNGAFNRGAGTVVFAGNSSISGSVSTQFQNVSITGTLNGPDRMILYGNFANTGTFNAGSGTVEFTYSANQTLSAQGAIFNNLEITKSGGSVTLTTALNLLGTMSVGSSSTLNTSDNLTILSTGDSPSVGGSIAALPTGAAISGNVTVQRYFGIKDNKNRYISMPVSNATVAMLQDDFAVTGSFTGTSYPCTGCSNNGMTLKRYNEAVLGAQSNGYVSAVNSSNTEQLSTGIGYVAYMWNGVAPTLLDVTGTINRGQINFTVSHTASSPAVFSADGWNLIGNPYPSPIQWSNGAGWTKSNIDPVVWVWDVTTEVWHSYNADIDDGDLVDGVIATGQGFWVWAPTPGAASLSINENAKSTAGGGSYYRKNNQGHARITISLKQGDATDNLFLLPDETATQQLDIGLDAPKIELGIERLHLAVLEGDVKLGYAGLSTAQEDIALTVVQGEEGSGSLMFTGASIADHLANYYLIDEKLEESVRLANGLVYDFEYEYGDEYRFRLSTTPLEKTERAFRMEVYPNPTRDRAYVAIEADGLQSVTILDVSGKVIAEADMQQNSGEGATFDFDLADVMPGIYLVRVATKGGVATQRLVKK